MSGPPPAPSLDGWRRLNFFATLAIAVTLPLAHLRYRLDRPPTFEEKPAFVGSAACYDCHRAAYEKWMGSYHERSMAAATEQTVEGDFNDASFDYFGVVSRFYRKNGGFWVYTEGSDGKTTDYEVVFVFGVYPLQQYLVKFPGGRYQCLSIAWDEVKNRWYHLYPNERIAAGDWLHWTRGAQNWNGMCSECHSTNLRKGYDPDTDTYATTYSEINVSCEACHGPASLHVKWARLPAMARPASEDYRLVISTEGMSAREQVELCAPCHSRRFYMQDYAHQPGTDLLDHEVPSLLDEHLYFPDGQIRDEVYEYASFVQSKMYRQGVRCTDCHDPHGTKRHKPGNDLCLQCHKGDVYNTSLHHFHKEAVDGKPSPGWLCENCHMPRRVYMGVDWRLDHSIRIPRPDMSLALGVPNACTNPFCHADKGDTWAADVYTRWYGQKRPPHYGTVIAAAREGRPEARADLLRLTQDRLYPVTVRATAISLTDWYPGQETRDALAKALHDEESSVRRAALDRADLFAPDERVRRVTPLLQDPVKGVRIEAAVTLAQTPGYVTPPGQAVAFQAALAEFESAMRYQADFQTSGYNLGNLYAALGRREDAEQEYRRAIRIDPLFVRTRVNYATLLSATGRNPEAEAQLREALKTEPGQPAAAYNLGLLLAEMGRMPEAVTWLEHAAASMPANTRVHYNLAMAYRETGKMAQAETSLLRGLELEPGEADFLFALGDLYARQGKLEKARKTAVLWIQTHPDDNRAKQFIRALGGPG
jgi:predicted CXXCH cytochrome family protein